MVFEHPSTSSPQSFGDISLRSLFKITLSDYQIKDYKCFLFPVITTGLPPEKKHNPLKVPPETLVMLVSPVARLSASRDLLPELMELSEALENPWDSPDPARQWLVPETCAELKSGLRIVLLRELRQGEALDIRLDTGTWGGSERGNAFSRPTGEADFLSKARKGENIPGKCLGERNTSSGPRQTSLDSSPSSRALHNHGLLHN